MKRRTSLQAEILTSLALVMFVATGVLALLIGFSLANVRQLQNERYSVWLINALLVEAYVERPDAVSMFPGIVWWTVFEAEQRGVGQFERSDLGQVPQGDTDSSRSISAPNRSEQLTEKWQSRGPNQFEPDAEAREIVAAVRREGRPLLSNSLPWEPVYFAAQDIRRNGVLVARLPANIEGAPFLATRSFLLFLLAADTAVFVGFGFYLLRRRVIVPLQNLARAARTVADGALDARVPEEGSLETVEVAQAFNAMTGALERRSAALEDAVTNLSQANAELRMARAGLERAERLAAIGKLAAGVAHEVGNPIGALLAFLDLARRDPGISEATREQLQRAGREGERVRRILRQLLDFSRPPAYVPQAVDVAAVMREMADLIETQKSFGKGIIAIRVDGEAPKAFADPALVAQILLNLLVNAADAVRNLPEPKIDIRIFVTETTGGAAEHAPEGLVSHPVHTFVECVVSDNGPGVPEEIRERIFDLFFTTKDPGQGTGIGLANSARFAEQMDGQLKLVPSAQGACFVLRLPVLDSEQASGVKAKSGSP